MIKMMPLLQASERMKSYSESSFLFLKGTVLAPRFFRFGVGMLVSLSLLGGGYWVVSQSGWTPPVMLAALFPQEKRGSVFDEQAGVPLEQARQRYKASLQAVQEKQYERAIEGFASLEPVYPGLADLLLLHQGDSYASLGQEKPAQERYKILLLQHPNSPLQALATYSLAQSAYRSGKKEEAQRYFESLQRENPDTPYAVGSLYYLGNLGKGTGGVVSPNTERYWWEYLNQSPDGRFSAEIARTLMEKYPLQPAPEPNKSRLLGLGLAYDGNDLKNAIQYMEKAPFDEVWLELGRAQLKSGKQAEGLATLSRGLSVGKNREDGKKAVDMILRNSPSREKTLSLLKPAMQGVAPPPAGDYILWQLANLDAAKSREYYQSLVARYPTGDYAPESSWWLLWPLLRDQRYSEFLAQGETHLKRYPYAKSAAKVLFWQGKVLEMGGEKSMAIARYERVLKTHPHSYYAFRSAGRLAAIQDRQSDPGWVTRVPRKHYPPSESQSAFTVLPPKDAVKETLYPVLEELQAMAEPGELALLLNEAQGEVPAAVESWRYFTQGDRPNGIRTIRDHLDERAKTGYLPTDDELKLLYPVFFAEGIAQESPKNKLDPYLVQSLMREESYFNELAVSGSNARGLMQLLPSTAKEVSQNWLKTPLQTLDLFTPEINIRLGTHYLGFLHRTFNGNSMLSVGAYNGGPNAMKRWLGNTNTLTSDPDLFVEKIPYEQTRDYIKKVYTSYWNYTRLYEPPESSGP
jgi:soluble lytic murein transglycosylase